jgi:hypothetical protein
MRTSLLFVPLALVMATVSADVFPNPCKRSDLSDSTFPQRAAMRSSSDLQIRGRIAASAVSWGFPAAEGLLNHGMI